MRKFLEATLKLDKFFLPTILVLGFLSLSWGQDWVNAEDWTRTGKMFWAGFLFSALAGIAVARKSHWTIGLFLAWVLARWVSLRYAPMLLIEPILIAGSIFAAIFIYEQKFYRLIGHLVVIDALALSLLGLCEVFGYFPLHQIPHEFKMRGLMWAPISAHGHATLLGPYLAISLAFIPGFPRLFRSASREVTWRAMAVATILLCIVFTQSTLTWLTLGTVVALAIGFYLGTRAFFKIGAVLGLILAATIAFNPIVASTSGRWQHWRWAWGRSHAVGYGPGTWKPIYFQKHVAEWRAYQEAMQADMKADPPREFFDSVHNEYLQGVFEFGYIGMIPVVIALLLMVRITLKGFLLRRRELFPWAAVVMGLAVDSVGNFILHTFPAGLLLALAMVVMFRHDFTRD